MRFLRIILLVALLISTATNTALSQSFHTPFITSITYQNIGTSQATVTFKFYVQGSSSPTIVTRTLAAGAGSSLFVDAIGLGLPRLFIGSVVMSANQNVVATLVQTPDSLYARNRLLSNAAKVGSTKVMVPTLFYRKYNTSSKFLVQNTSTSNIDVTAKIYNINNPSIPTHLVSIPALPPGATRYIVMGDGNGDPDAYVVFLSPQSTYEGSAIIEGFVSGTTTPATIAATVFELSETDQVYLARAYEGIGSGANTLYMATALCKSFNSSTSYAVQNVGSNSASVTVNYSNGTVDSATIAPNGKISFNACTVNPSNFSGTAKIISTGGQIVGVGKKFIDNPSAPDVSYGTAFLGETQGSAKLAFPFVRYTADTTYNDGTRQRTFLAIQNIGGSTVTNVLVKYLNNVGTVIGTHTIPSIASNTKANSRAIDATGNTAQLQEFGYPEGNNNGGFGGSVIIQAPSGSQLIAVATVASRNINTGRDVAEDYNAIQIP